MPTYIEDVEAQAEYNEEKIEELESQIGLLRDDIELLKGKYWDLEVRYENLKRKTRSRATLAELQMLRENLEKKLDELRGEDSIERLLKTLEERMKERVIDKLVAQSFH